MHAKTMTAVAMALTMIVAGAAAQGTPSGAPAASATKSSPPARGPGARWGAGYTSGWAMMTPQERDEHRQQMQGAKTRDECQAVMEQHHQQMVERAKQQGKAVPAQPRRNACAAFKA